LFESEETMPQERRTALITGASAGIGRELAKVFAQHGFDLIVVSRSQDKLEELAREIEGAANVRVVVLAKDLMKPNAPQEVFQAVQDQGLSVEVLVNNAGIALFEPFKNSQLDEVLKLIQLNVVALTALTRLFLDPMLERRRGRILNVASVAGFQATPSFAVYGATKAFALSLSEALSEELRGTGVTVTALCPGFTNTEMVHGAASKGGIEGLLPTALLQSVEQVAREGYEACMAGRPIRINGVAYQLGVQWIRLQPRWLVRRVAGFWARVMMNDA
jgi:short-subunit dehydrogenase